MRRRAEAVSRRRVHSTQQHRGTHGVEQHAKTTLWRIVAVAACMA